ncbi:hypothetical protein G6F22_013268 [Rhizopus arrhizus]|nr:hypothetical protein G6F22_013268 [Rhizopus arrhizus]
MEQLEREILAELGIADPQLHHATDRGRPLRRPAGAGRAHRPAHRCHRSHRAALAAARPGAAVAPLPGGRAGDRHDRAVPQRPGAARTRPRPADDLDAADAGGCAGAAGAVADDAATTPGPARQWAAVLPCLAHLAAGAVRTRRGLHDADPECRAEPGALADGRWAGADRGLGHRGAGPPRDAVGADYPAADAPARSDDWCRPPYHPAVHPFLGAMMAPHRLRIPPPGPAGVDRVPAARGRSRRAGAAAGRPAEGRGPGPAAVAAGQPVHERVPAGPADHRLRRGHRAGGGGRRQHHGGA